MSDTPAHSAVHVSTRWAHEAFTPTSPKVTESALIDAIRVQLRTWVTRSLGIAIPDRIETAPDLSDLVHDIAEHAEEQWGDFDDDSSIMGVAHVINAHADTLRAAYGHGDGHLLQALTSLNIAARILA
ncbi:MAG: hypothetical protein JO362_22030 [Streptomycetaceae bacterium]|nr:hypothetical protein [Streptomycetaceae bacterium]